MDATTNGTAQDMPAAALRLRASALKLYARQGPAGTGVREIAADAEAAPGLIRHHFGSKAGLTRAVDDLVLSVIAETLEAATEQAAAGHSGTDPNGRRPDDPTPAAASQVPSAARSTAAAVSAARDEAFARMLRENPEIAGYLRWCLIAPASDNRADTGPRLSSDSGSDSGSVSGSGVRPPSGSDSSARDSASADDGLAERLVDFTLSEAQRLRRAGAGGSRDLRTSVLSTLLRQIGSMVVQPVTDRLWQRLEPAANDPLREAQAPRVRIAMSPEEPPEQG